MIAYQAVLTPEQKKEKQARIQTRRWVKEYKAAYENAISPLACETAYSRLKKPNKCKVKKW